MSEILKEIFISQYNGAWNDTDYSNEEIKYEKFIRFDEMERILNNNQSAFEANLKQKDEEIKMLKQQLNLKGIDMKDCKYLLVNAEVRYWDDEKKSSEILGKEK